MDRLAHTSFKAGTRENVDALTEQMRSEGYEITDGPVVGKDGLLRQFLWLDPDGNTVRIVA